jgi:hypothetical protein
MHQNETTITAFLFLAVMFLAGFDLGHAHSKMHDIETTITE